MIRFVDLGSQLGIDESWPRCFAFFNTVPDQFCNFSDSEEWICWEDFERDYDGNDLERFRSLCPEWVFLAKTWEELKDV